MCKELCYDVWVVCILLVSAVSVKRINFCWYKVFTYDVYGCCCNNILKSTILASNKIILFFFNQPPLGVG